MAADDGELACSRGSSHADQQAQLPGTASLPPGPTPAVRQVDAECTTP